MVEVMAIVSLKVKSHNIFSNYYMEGSCIGPHHASLLTSELFCSAEDIKDFDDKIVILLKDPIREITLNKKYLESYCFEYK